MVTFICYNCDKTLKKNQVDRHTFCKPAAFICIDCHKTFYGQDYKAHISCISQQEKHWGQYHKKKGEKAVPATNGNTVHKEPEPIIATELVENSIEDGWKGWKNEIKRAIREQESPIELQKLRETVNKRYSTLHTEAPLDNEAFEEKLKSIKKIKLQTFASLE